MIEPSTGFGTGHHETTRLCLLLMQRLDLRGARVLDIGTGSGVLALAAWKLGAGDVVAIDSDPDALDNARDNIARNGAAPSIDIIRDDLESLRIQRADVVLANLTGAVLVTLRGRTEGAGARRRLLHLQRLRARGPRGDPDGVRRPPGDRRADRRRVGRDVSQGLGGFTGTRAFSSSNQLSTTIRLPLEAFDSPGPSLSIRKR